MSIQTVLKPFQQIPKHLQTLADYEKQAEYHITENTWHYLQGGAMHEKSVVENIEQFNQYQLIPRHLNEFSEGNTICKILGQSFPHPIFLSPIGHQQLFHPEGEKASALAAEVLQSNFILSNFSNTPLETLNPENPLKWFQLYWQGDRERSLALIKLAEEYNFKAVVITIDSPHKGIRDRERRAFFEFPAEMQHPHMSAYLPLPEITVNQSPVFHSLMHISPKWADIEWLIAQTQLPIILKGVLHTNDAEMAVRIGVKALIVSNHGGRVLDTTISPLTALQQIRRIVPADYPLIIEGGIRRGSDVFKALALGATAVSIGRPYIHGLAVAGALGVAHVIRILKEEFEITMALMGTPSIAEINSDYIYQG